MSFGTPHNSIHRILLGQVTCLLLTCLASGFCEAACLPGEISNHKAHRAGLQRHLQDPATGATASNSGLLRISSILLEGTEISTNGYRSQLRIRESYSSISNEFGAVVRETVYSLESDNQCQDFIVIAAQSEPPHNIGVPNPELTDVVRSSFAKFLADPESLPTNRHSSDFSSAIYSPEVCPGSLNYSVNLVRSNHQSTGITYRTWSYLVDSASGKILREAVRPGRLLSNMCK